MKYTDTIVDPSVRRMVQDVIDTLLNNGYELGSNDEFEPPLHFHRDPSMALRHPRMYVDDYVVVHARIDRGRGKVEYDWVKLVVSGTSQDVVNDYTIGLESCLGPLCDRRA